MRRAVRIRLRHPHPSPRCIEISEEVHEIAARAALGEFKGHRRNAHLGDSGAVRGDSLRFDFWRWTLASIGIARVRPQERGRVRGRARMPRRFNNLKNSDEEAANRRIKSRKRIQAVATKNSESAEKSGVFGFTDAISPVCLSSCDRSSVGLDADSAVGRLWNQRTSPSVTSCTFFAASGQVGPSYSRSTACSGSCSTDCGHAVWTRWCWSSRPPSFNGTVRDPDCFGVGAPDPGGRQWTARFVT
jgi:hypothetical protein